MSYVLFFAMRVKKNSTEVLLVNNNNNKKIDPLLGITRRHKKYQRIDFRALFEDREC